MKYLIANWKAQMTLYDVQTWIEIFRSAYKEKKDVTIIICPPYPFLMHLKEKLHGLKNVAVGAQTVSQFDHGKYTGEVSAKALQGIADYAIIGHSERRTNNHETEQQIQAQIALCNTYHINPVLCIRDEKDEIYDNVDLIAYEPVAAIGTGENEDPKKVLEMKESLVLPDNVSFIYGGSVTKENFKEYYEKGGVSGFLVGTASLEAGEFLKIM